MRVAIDVSPIAKTSDSAHRVRGVGSYINMLVANLPKYDTVNQYVFVEDKNFPTNADLIHYPYFDPFFQTLPFKSPKKFIVTVHDLTPIVFSKNFPVGIKGRVNWEVQKRLLSTARFVVTDSNKSTEDVVKLTGVKQERVKTVYLAASQLFKKLNAVDLKELRTVHNLPVNFILYVGDATWNKNLPRLINVIKKTKHKLALVGKIWESSAKDVADHPWNNDLKEVLLRIENDSQFQQLGYVSDEDLVKIYNLATVLIMPSTYEGFGLPVLEAMSCGCPVIASKAGSLPEIGGQAVYYIDAQNEESILQGINNLMSDENLRSDLSLKGIEQSKNFTLEKSIRNLIQVYEQA